MAYQLLLYSIQYEVQKRGKDFILSVELNELLRNISFWLTEDSHYFGYMMCGLCGNGKTTVVKALRTLLNQLDFRDDYNSHWELSLYDAKTICRMAISDENQFNNLCYAKMLAIDDLGCEPVEIQSYGNIYTPITDLLTLRYDRQLFTIITTNMTPREIRSRYGDRIADRLNEMMRCIVFKNDTFRTSGLSGRS